MLERVCTLVFVILIATRLITVKYNIYGASFSRDGFLYVLGPKYVRMYFEEAVLYVYTVLRSFLNRKEVDLSYYSP